MAGKKAQKHSRKKVTEYKGADFPIGVDGIYPKEMSVGVKESSYTDKHLVDHRDVGKQLLTISIEDLSLERFEPGFRTPKESFRSCKNSVTFLRALLSASESTPMHNFNALNAEFSSAVGAGASTHPDSGDVFNASAEVMREKRLASNAKSMKRLRNTSAAVSRLSHFNKIIPSEEFIDKEIKAKHEEIEGLRRKLVEEQHQNEKLQKKIDDLCQSETDSVGKMARAQEMADKLRAENKKMAECIEKLERNISHMEDRMRNLEIKASEVEKAEITLEITKKNLESCQIDLKLKERQLEREKEKFDEQCNELKEAHSKQKELEAKLNDLKIQIRHELLKNENIEKGLETIPRLRDEIQEKQLKINALEKELAEKSALLNSSRKSSRELKDKLREVDTQEDKCQLLKDELELVQNEVTTLKRLMCGKDVLIQQRCLQLDQAKVAVDSFCQNATSYEEETRLKQINKVLSKLQQICFKSLGQENHNVQKSIDQGRSKSALQGRDFNYSSTFSDDTNIRKENTFNLDLSRLKNDQSDKPKGSSKSSTTSSAGSGSLVRRSASFHHFTNESVGSTLAQNKEKCLQSPSRSRISETPYLNSSVQRRNTNGSLQVPEKTPKLTSKYRPSLDYSASKGAKPTSSYIVSKQNPSKSASSAPNDARTEDSYKESFLAIETLLSKPTRKEQKILATMSPSLWDSILCDVIQNGDRVSVEMVQKPPRYGKKQAKPITYSGLVKYMGPIENAEKDSAVYVGIRLDEPIGDSDGVFKGTRYIFTPPNYAKFCKIQELDTVLDIALGVYVPIPKLILQRYQENVSQEVGSGDQRVSASSNDGSLASQA